MRIEEPLRLAKVESKFADIIWREEPISSGELARICEEELGWKRTTTYTVLKKLCDRGIFQNDGKKVTSLMSRAEFNAARSERFVEDNFEGSLPAFIAAFTTRSRLTEAEIAEIRAMIDNYDGGEAK